MIEPSIEREIRSELTEVGEEAAIDNFGKNLEALLLTPPMKEKIVLAFDPGFVNGCKLAVVDKNGKYLDSTVIKPFLNGNTEERIKLADLKIKVEGVSTTKLVKFNGNIYGESFAVIDYAGDLNKSIGKIDFLIEEKYLPQFLEALNKQTYDHHCI